MSKLSDIEEFLNQPIDELNSLVTQRICVSETEVLLLYLQVSKPTHQLGL